VLDAPLTINKITQPISYFFSEERFAQKGLVGTETLDDGTQVVVIQVKSNGYSPNKIMVKAGIPVQLTLQTQDTYSCASSFILKAFNIRLQLGPTDSETVYFTPTEVGKFPFTCSMGMYSGVLEVI